MFTRPLELSDDDVGAAVLAGWGHAPTEVAYAPVGFGSHHWHVNTDAGPRFLTVDDLVARRTHPAEPADLVRDTLVAALATARDLRDAGLEFVISPLRTMTGGVTIGLGARFVAHLYPSIDGRTSSFGPYAESEVRDAVVDLLIRLHRTPRAAVPHIRHDELALTEREELERALDGIPPGGAGPYIAEAGRLLAARADEIRAALDVYDGIVREVKARPERLVVTHGEPHAGNAIVTTAGPVLVDWDTALLAPPERDLWSISTEDRATLSRYARGAGTAPDLAAIQCYRLRWDLSEIAQYAALMRRDHSATADTATAWSGLQEYLEPDRLANALRRPERS